MVLPLEDGWELTKHAGILLSTDGTRMYGCSKCAYVNNRLYHTKMHHKRIHIENGRALARRRKFEGRSGPSVPSPPVSTQNLKININSEEHKQLVQLCRRKICTASRTALHRMRRIVHNEVQMRGGADGRRVFQHVMTFGEFAMTPGLYPYKATASAPCAARRKALQEIAGGFVATVLECVIKTEDGASRLVGRPESRVPSASEVSMCEEAGETNTHKELHLSADGGQQDASVFVCSPDSFLVQ